MTGCPCGTLFFSFWCAIIGVAQKGLTHRFWLQLRNISALLTLTKRSLAPLAPAPPTSILLLPTKSRKTTCLFAKSAPMMSKTSPVHTVDKVIQCLLPFWPSPSGDATDTDTLSIDRLFERIQNIDSEISTIRHKAMRSKDSITTERNRASRPGCGYSDAWFQRQQPDPPLTSPRCVSNS